MRMPLGQMSCSSCVDNDGGERQLITTEYHGCLSLTVDAQEPRGPMKDTMSTMVRISNAMTHCPAIEDNLADHWWSELVNTAWPVVSFDLWSTNID